MLLEVGGQVVCERGLQRWVTHRDAERVGVVVDVEQLCDAGLRGVSTQLHLQVGLLVEAVAQVQCRREIGHRAGGVDRNAKVLLDVVRVLRLDGDTHVHVELVAHNSQLEVDVLSVLGTLRIAAQTVAEIHLVGVVEITEESGPLLIVVEHVLESRFAQVGEVEGGGVAFLEAVIEAVVQLQEDALRAKTAHAVAVAERTASLWHSVFRLWFRFKDV